MKRLLFAAVIFLLATMLFADFGGFVYLDTGEVIEITKFNYMWYDTSGSSNDGKRDYFVIRRNKETSDTIRVPWEDVIEVHAVDGHVGSRDALVYVKLRNGSEGEFYMYSTRSYVSAEYVDSFTKVFTTKKYRLNRDVKRMVFSDDFGNMRINPKTNQVFPVDYNFDPYTGEELKYVEVD
jgi:hypothetical protein